MLLLLLLPAHHSLFPRSHGRPRREKETPDKRPTSRTGTRLIQERALDKVLNAALAVVNVGKLGGAENNVLLVAHDVGPGVACRAHRQHVELWAHSAEIHPIVDRVSARACPVALFQHGEPARSRLAGHDSAARDARRGRRAGASVHAAARDVRRSQPQRVTCVAAMQLAAGSTRHAAAAEHSQGREEPHLRRAPRAPVPARAGSRAAVPSKPPGQIDENTREHIWIHGRTRYIFSFPKIG